MSFLSSFLTPSTSNSDEAPRERKKLPRVVFIVSGAAMAMTIGLTVMMVPYLRQAIRHAKTVPDSLSNRHLDLRSTRLKELSLASSRNQPATSSSPIVPHTLETPLPSSSFTSSASTLDNELHGETTMSPEMENIRSFNNNEERHLYGSVTSSLDPQPLGEASTRTSKAIEEDSKAVSALMGIQALGIATALVFGSTGLGVFIVAKLLGVDDMTEFRIRMRETLQSSMPGLVSSIHEDHSVDRHLRPGNKVTEEDQVAMDELNDWFRSLDEHGNEQTETKPS
ncbi:hypothetical protein BCR39DRAFT_588842 [Naematelia encephala]|uniref:Transmembrane protein 242 n=1 Tax=Naematelia encephala TaxID=71784 RepID=A0A1Y2B002_9TREE|nr:hypothetical protein BCR39DRAFT_588842 [Naematelia encephala]